MVKDKASLANRKWPSIAQLVIWIGVLVMLNVISSFFFKRIDLTGDHRYTISKQSIQLVSTLKDVVYIKVYLKGDFSPGFTRLSNSTKELLDELRNYSKGNLEYEFIDPSENKDEKSRNDLYAQLYRKGIQPTTIEEREKEGMSRKYIFPGALISFSNQEIGVQLLKNQLGAPPEMMLNNSIENLEYEICNGIRKVTNPLKPKVAFLEGQHELNDTAVFDITNTLSASYEVRRIKLNEQLQALKGIKTVVIAKPDSAFTEKDKFILDQFVMRGGRILWCIDPVIASMDSMNGKGETIGLARDLNLDDMLFRYGVRVNYDLIQDIVCSVIPVVSGYVGNQPKTQLMPWYFFPVLTPESTHPIVNNLNSVKAEFVSSIDTISVSGVRKTVLLNTSQYSKVLAAPVRISLGIMSLKPSPAMFPVSYVPVAVLLEGTFTSLYKNRIPPALMQSNEVGFRDSSVSNRMIIVSDGDILRNKINKGAPVALGYDRYSKTVFGNKALIENMIDYLCDDSGLMALRKKEFKLRLLDPTKIEDDMMKIKIINTGLPLVLIISLAVTRLLLRRSRYIHSKK